MGNGFFIAGTDTGVGKTYVSLELMRTLQEENKTVLGFKPVAAGAERINGVLQNSDAMQLLKQASQEFSYQQVNPYCYKAAIAPHIAAELAGETIKLGKIQTSYEALARQADVVVVEGAGGWATPLNDRQGLDDVALQLDLPVILVVGLKLGCINHALLTQAAIQQKGCVVLGWVGNQLNASFEEESQNLQALNKRLKSPCLGVLKFQENAARSGVVKQINTQVLLDYLASFR